MKEKILSVISNETIYPYRIIEAIYKETKSYDTTIELCNVCSRINIGASEILSVIRIYNKIDFIDKITIAGLSGAAGSKKLRNVLGKLNGKNN